MDYKCSGLYTMPYLTDSEEIVISILSPEHSQRDHQTTLVALVIISKLMPDLIVKTQEGTEIECERFEEMDKGIRLFNDTTIKTGNLAGYVPYDNLLLIREKSES